jgi:diaminopimelate epimerase
VSWYAELQGGVQPRVRARIFERGVGETSSSGTGATGAAVAYLLEVPGDANAWADGAASVTVVLDGGELLVEVDEELRVHLSGWAVPVFSGELSEPFEAELQALESNL